jgi:HlyD family secretion protein
MRTWFLIALLIVAAAAIAVYARSGGEPVDAARASHAEIHEFVDEQGQTRLPQTYLVTMPYNGRITPITLAEGAAVKAGDVVAQVVPSDLELAVDQAQSAVERTAASIRENDDTSVESTALQQSLKIVDSMARTVDAAAQQVKSGEAKLDYSNKTLKRMRTLRETNAASDQDVNQAELSQIQASVEYQQDLLILTALKSVQAATALVPTTIQQYITRKSLAHDVLEKEKAQAKIKHRQQLMDQQRGRMTSPVDGVVLERAESNERQVAAGTVLLKIGRPQDLEVEADILSQDVVNVKPGNAVEIYGPAIGAKPARGKVSQVYPAGFTKVSSLGVEQQRVKVIVAFDPSELPNLRQERGLGVGYRVRVRIFTAEKPRGLVVPRSALFRGPAGNWQVFAVRGDRAKLQTVQVGLMNDERVEITEGLAENDTVILAPETTLADGTRVRPVLNE